MHLTAVLRNGGRVDPQYRAEQAPYAAPSGSPLIGSDAVVSRCAVMAARQRLGLHSAPHAAALRTVVRVCCLRRDAWVNLNRQRGRIAWQ